MKTIQGLMKVKQRGEKIAMVTCYDYTSACIVNQSDIDIVLVGDSAAMVMHGYESTVPATVEMMSAHVAAVRRGMPDKFLVADMPFLAHRKGHEKSMDAVDALMKAGANAVKIEGGRDHLKSIRYIVKSGVPVMGHLGLTPQSVNQIGGWKVQGREDSQAEQIIEDAKSLEAVGVFALVLEMVPADLAEQVTVELAIPTIGIGAGPETSGQVLVFQDVLGMNPSFHPKFLRTYMDGLGQIQSALNTYTKDVKEGMFPNADESF